MLLLEAVNNTVGIALTIIVTLDVTGLQGPFVMV